MVDDAVLDRAGELKRMLVAYSQQPRYDRVWQQILDRHGSPEVLWDEHRMMALWDYLVLEHRLANGRTVVEQFVDAHPELSDQERAMLLGWRDVVQGPFEVQRRDGPALITVNLVDELTYRLRANTGPSVFRRISRGSFLIARVVAVGDEWMLSGPTSVLRPRDRDAAHQLAAEMSMRTPEAAYRNPDKLATAWQHQQHYRESFIQFFGSDLVLVPGHKAAQQLDEFWSYCRDNAAAGDAPAGSDGDGGSLPPTELPPEMVESETVALIFDREDGLGYYAEYGLAQAAFADPGLLRRRRHRETVLSYLHDDSVPPTVLRRLADQDADKASIVFRRLLKRSRFDWRTDGEELLRRYKADHLAQPRRPQFCPLSPRLAEHVQRR